MPTTLELTEINFGEYDGDIYAVPEDLFFQDREQGIVRPNTLPLPAEVRRWQHGTFKGEPVHVAHVGKTIYMVADTTKFGYCLFRYVSQSENDTIFRVAYQRGTRIITNERSNIFMANNNPNSLANIAAQYRNNQGASVNPMNLGGGYTAPAAPMAPVSGEGIGAVDPIRLRREAVSRGYVAGYIMANAPAISMSLVSAKDKDGHKSYSIVAKQSKPSRTLGILMALPASCVTRNGVLASPSDISAGNVEYNPNNTDMIYQVYKDEAAIAYIYALGCQLPEYAPTCVDGAREHWSPEDILSGKPHVTYVVVKATQNRSKKSTIQDEFRFSLKSTSPRKSLYTEKNHVCLRALEHVSVACTTEEQAYEVNNNAFRAWNYRTVRDGAKDETAMKRAMNNAPTQIWEKQYTVNGETVDGIGSCFFMVGSSDTREGGEIVSVKNLEYVPWYMTGDRRSVTLPRVDKLVKRTWHAADGDKKKEGMSTTPVTFKEKPNDPMFRIYSGFVDYATKTGYLTRERLAEMGSRTSKAKSKSVALTPEQSSCLQYFMKRDDVASAIQSVRDEAADRAALASLKTR